MYKFKNKLQSIFDTFHQYSLTVTVLLIFVVLFNGCSPTIYLPKQNLNELPDEVKNTEGDDIAPAQEKLLECDNCVNQSKIKLPDSTAVMPSASYIDKLFIPEINEDDELLNLKRRNNLDLSNYKMSSKNPSVDKIAAVKNMTANVESIYFISASGGFASFSHPPSFEYLASHYLPFEKSEPKGGTDIFFFGTNKNDNIRFKELHDINSPYWDSHPTAITQNDSKGKCVTLLIFSTDRDNPFNKAINLSGDTIYGGSTDLYYSFGVFDPTLNIDTLDYVGYKWTVPQALYNANTKDFNEGSPFVYCQKYNPTLLFSSNRGNQNQYDYDIYAAKLTIDFDNLTISVISAPELIDEKSPVTDSLTRRINTIADERFPYVPFPHLDSASQNPLYFSSDRNKKPVQYECDCELGNDRTENIGGYDIYKYQLPEKYNCPKPKEIIPIIYEPELFTDIVVINYTNPNNPVKNAIIKLKDDKGNIIEEISNSDRLRVKLDFNKHYQVIGGSTLNSRDCDSDGDIIFRGYKATGESYIEKQIDSVIYVEMLTSFSMEASEFLKIKQDLTKKESGFIIEKGIKLKSDNLINEKIINARIIGDMVYYDKQVTTTKYWNRIELIPSSYTDEFAEEKALNGQVRSISTMNERYFVPEPESNEKIIIQDTIYLLPDYIIKPPCYCEFKGILTTYQQNVPYFQTGFWQVNTLKNFRRDMNELEKFNYNDASWIELHKNNQNFGEIKSGRYNRIIEYENFAKVVDSNLYKMAEMISRNIIPAFKIIDSITPGSKLIISLDAWSDSRPVIRGWYIGEEINYVSGTLNEGLNDYDVDFQKVVIDNGSLLNKNNDTLSRLRAYYGYVELLKKLLDTVSVGTGFYDYYKAGLTLLPDDEKLKDINLNKPFSLKSVEELIYKSKIILLTKGNYFDSTQYKVPQYLRNVDSSLYMLDTIRRIDVTINTLEYQAGKLIKSECCNPNLPCVDFRRLINFFNNPPDINATDPRRKRN